MLNETFAFLCGSTAAVGARGYSKATKKADRKAGRRNRRQKKKAAAWYLRRAKRVVEAVLHLWLFDSLLSKQRHVTSRKMKNT